MDSHIITQSKISKKGSIFYCLLFENKKLFLHTEKFKKLDLMFGHIDKNESIEDNIVREILIRYKVVVRNLLLTGAFSKLRKDEYHYLFLGQAYEVLNKSKKS